MGADGGFILRRSQVTDLNFAVRGAAIEEVMQVVVPCLHASLRALPEYTLAQTLSERIAERSQLNSQACVKLYCSCWQSC